MILSELLVLSELEIFNEDALEKLQKRTSIVTFSQKTPSATQRCDHADE